MKRVLASLAFLAAALAFACESGAHDWYPIQCCSNQDCAQVPAASVKRTPQGWRLPSGHVLAFDDARVKPLPPGKVGVHVCERNDAARTPICLFIGEVEQ